MIQELVKLLGLTALDLGISAEEIVQVNTRVTFKDVEAYMATAKYPSTVTPSSVNLTGTSGGVYGSSAFSVLNISTTTTKAPLLVTAPLQITLVNKDENLQKEIEALSPPLPKPTPIISHPYLLSLDDINLTCDDLKTAGRSAAMIRSNDIGRMEKAEVADCLEVFGNMDISEAVRPDIWAAIKNKLEFKNKISGGEMINLNKLLPEVARFSPELLNLDQSNIDAISVLGKHSDQLVHEYIKVNKKVVLNELEMRSLGRMLCGLSSDDWHALVDRQTFLKVMNPSIVSLNCAADEKVN